MVSDIKWTAREAIACAYCWSEFKAPDLAFPGGCPEQYWRHISERARNECRAIANKRLLLAVARGQALAIPPEGYLSNDSIRLIGANIGIARTWRVRQIIGGLWRALAAAKGEANMYGEILDGDCGS